MNNTLTPTNDEWIVTDNENYIEIASIKTCDSIASVHGGKTIGDQYDLAGRIARVPQLERELTAVTEKLKETQEALAAEIKHHTDIRTAVGDPTFLKALCELLMCSDPWPASADSEIEVKSKADEMARKLGFSDWVEAYHGL